MTGFFGCPTPRPPWVVWLTLRVSDTVGAIRAVLRSTFFSEVTGVMEVVCCGCSIFRYFSKLAELVVFIGPVAVLMMLFCCRTVDVVVISSVVVVISASASAVAVVVEDAVVVFNVVARPAVILFALARSAFPLAVKFFVFFVMVVIVVPAAEIC